MPRCLEQTFRNGNVLIVWEITEDLDFIEDKITLSDSLKRIYDSITAISRKKEWLISKLIILEFLGTEIEYHYNNRKLILTGTNTKVSISHTKEFCCVLFSESECGIDIESQNRNFDRVAKRFLSSKEFAQINAKQYSIAWCAKEALYKKISENIIEFNEDFIIESILNNIVKIKYNNLHYTLNYQEYKNNIICYTI